MNDVFVSYAREDAELADRLSDMLATSGLRVFRDKAGLVAGESSSNQIADALAKADVVVVLLSRHSKRSRWVEHELAHALESPKTVIPVLLDPDATENWVWPLVADRQAVTVRRPADLEQVVQYVKASTKPARPYVAEALASRSPSRWLLWIVAALSALISALVTSLLR